MLKAGEIMADRKVGKSKLVLTGCAVGFLNGLFGSGGGIAAVPLLRSCGIEQKSAHACSLAVTLPLSILSAALYLGTRELPWQEALRLIPAGLPGALLGGILLKKIPNKPLKRLFGIMMIIAGGRLIFR